MAQEVAVDRLPSGTPIETHPEAQQGSRAGTQRLRLEYLDGIRGIAAFYVVLIHIYIALMFTVPGVELVPALGDAMRRAHMGGRIITVVLAIVSHAFSLPAVPVFIVLSGYCLMLPVVQSKGTLRGGFWGFMRRRATRILPPYFGMVAVALIISAIMNAQALRDPPVDDFAWDIIVSHLLLIHNFSERWLHAIDPPMWSIAVEWQIYFFFPLLVLPVWRRLGSGAAVAITFLVGVAPHFLLHGYLDWSCPWYLGLFTLGVAAADINLSANERQHAWSARLPWGRISLALWIGNVLVGALQKGWLSRNRVVSDTLIGLATMTMLVSCSRAALLGARAGSNPALRIFDARPVTQLGAFSYSVYLTHYPPLMLFFFLTMRLQMSVLARAGLMFGLFLPFSIVFAYGFYRVFERPFISQRSGQRATASERTA